jgi:rubrerythrin
MLRVSKKARREQPGPSWNPYDSGTSPPPPISTASRAAGGRAAGRRYRIEAEQAAIAAYGELAHLADGSDYVTDDLAVSVLADEEGHRRLFEGLLG